MVFVNIVHKITQLSILVQHDFAHPDGRFYSHVEMNGLAHHQVTLKMINQSLSIKYIHWYIV